MPLLTACRAVGLLDSSEDTTAPKTPSRGTQRRGVRVKQRGRKLGRVMRWGVYACTVVCIALIPISFVWKPGAMLSGYGKPSGELVQAYSVGVDRGRLLFHTFTPTRYSWSGDVDRGTKWSFRPQQAGSLLLWKSAPWWDRPRVWEDPGFPTMVDVPLVYLSVLMLIASGLVWLLALRGWVLRSRRSSLCLSCGYSLEGLTTTTCPECGVNRA